MEYEINGRIYKLDETCSACPEQYDAFLDGELVGYFRLRHGYFTVEFCRNPDGEEVWEGVYDAEPKGDGIFEEDEREFYLMEGLKAIDAKIK